MIEIQTERLNLREVTLNDSTFMLELMNQPAWKKYIANHSIDTTQKVLEYIKSRMIRTYRKYGFGLWLVELLDESLPIGVCGLIKRDSLKHLDLGFGFLPKYWGQGFAYEASISCLEHAFESLGAPKVVAITVPANEKSLELLKKLGFRYESEYSEPGSDEVLSLYECTNNPTRLRAVEVPV